MSGQTNILLVEAEADRGFFEALCKKIQLEVDIKVATPRDSGNSHDTKQAAIKQLRDFYLPQLGDGHLDRLAVVLDADQTDHGNGYQYTLNLVEQLVTAASHGYNAPQCVKGSSGVFFHHPDGLNPLGLWVMPDNQRDGMVETFIRDCIDPREHDLLNHAMAAIDGIPGGPKFKSHHRIKAEISTLLAWQKDPGHGLYRLVEADLLHQTAPLYRELETWLRHVFLGPAASIDA